MKMKTALSVVAAAAVALFAQSSFAQDTTKSRADVKAEAKANKTPAGEVGQAPAKLPKSDKTKADRKAETAEAKKAHELAPAGETAGEKATPGTEKVSKSDKAKARAERKAEAARLRKEGKLAPAGETAVEKK